MFFSPSFNRSDKLNWGPDRDNCQSIAKIYINHQSTRSGHNPFFFPPTGDLLFFNISPVTLLVRKKKKYMRPAKNDPANWLLVFQCLICRLAQSTKPPSGMPQQHLSQHLRPLWYLIEVSRWPSRVETDWTGGEAQSIDQKRRALAQLTGSKGLAFQPLCPIL